MKKCPSNAKLFLFIFLIFCCLHGNAGVITKIKNNKALVQLDGENWTTGDTVTITNDSGQKIGTATVVSVKGTQGAIIEKTTGFFSIGNLVAINLAASAKRSTVAKTSENQKSNTSQRNQRPSQQETSNAVAGYFGRYSSQTSLTPMALGADYVFSIAAMEKLKWRGGITYWTVSEGGVSLNSIELSFGAGYPFHFDKLKLTPGLRVGYAQITASASAVGSRFTLSSSSFTFVPFANGLFQLTPTVALGGEIRTVTYLSGKGNFGGDFYYLLALEFNL